jgi:hypothetical protein
LRRIALPLLVGTRFQVLFTPLAGVLFAFPSRYWFTIGQKRVFSLTGWSPWIQAGFLVPRLTQVSASSPDCFRLRACHALWIPFPEDSASNRIGNSTCRRPYNPLCTEMQRVWARSDFARHYFRNRGFFLFLQVLRWFTSLSSLVPAYVFSGTYYGFAIVGFPIRTSPDRRLCAAPRSFSQLATSFIACFCQGIHRAPLVA